MPAPRQLHELMLWREAAEHQLALISDVAEITDTYPPPDEVPFANPSDYKNRAFANLLLKELRNQQHKNKCNEFC